MHYKLLILLLSVCSFSTGIKDNFHIQGENGYGGKIIVDSTNEISNPHLIIVKDSANDTLYSYLFSYVIDSSGWADSAGWAQVAEYADSAGVCGIADSARGVSPHGSTHRADSLDQLFNQNLDDTNSVTFDTITNRNFFEQTVPDSSLGTYFWIDTARIRQIFYGTAVGRVFKTLNGTANLWDTLGVGDEPGSGKQYNWRVNGYLGDHDNEYFIRSCGSPYSAYLFHHSGYLDITDSTGNDTLRNSKNTGQTYIYNGTRVYQIGHDSLWHKGIIKTDSNLYVEDTAFISEIISSDTVTIQSNIKAGASGVLRTYAGISTNILNAIGNTIVAGDVFQGNDTIKATTYLHVGDDIDYVEMHNDTGINLIGTANRISYNRVCSEWGDTINLTDGVATTLFTVNGIGDDDGTGGVVCYRIHVVGDEGDVQNRVGEINFSAYGTGVSTQSDITLSDTSEVIETGTLSDTWSVVENPTSIEVQLNANTSLTPVKMYAYIKVTLLDSKSVTLP